MKRSSFILYEDMDVDQSIFDYIEYVKSLGVNTKAAHWNSTHTGKWREIKRKMIKLFEKNLCLDPGDEIHRICNTRYCCNPLHYSIVQVENMEDLENINVLEIEELSELIDVELLRKMGFSGYFKYFNTGNPLPAELSDFYTASNIALKRNHKRLLPVSIIGGRIRRNACMVEKKKHRS